MKTVGPTGTGTLNLTGQTYATWSLDFEDHPSKNERNFMLRGGAVDIKTTKEIDLMREVCHLTAQTLSCVGEIIKSGDYHPRH